MKVFGEMWSSFGKEKDELTRRRETKAWSKRAVEAVLPDFKGITEEELPFLDAVLSSLLADIQSRWMASWHNLPEERQDWIVGDWMEQLWLSKRAHTNPEPIAHEFWLAFTDTTPFRRELCKMSVPERKMLQRGWLVLIRQALPESRMDTDNNSL